MELAAVAFMLVAGGALALFVLVAAAIARRESGSQQHRPHAVPHRDHVSASLLFELLVLGGASDAQALRLVRREAELAAPVTPGIDVFNWAEAYARGATSAQRAWLLEMAVRLVADRVGPLPLRQYSALLDLSFALGFQTDALAKLREQYGFEYIDHAKDARPREAETIPLFAKRKGDPRELLGVLHIEGRPTRQLIISAYRKLAAQHHPDRFFAASAEIQSEAAARFMEITRAYELLLVIYRD